MISECCVTCVIFLRVRVYVSSTVQLQHRSYYRQRAMTKKKEIEFQPVFKELELNFSLL